MSKLIEALNRLQSGNLRNVILPLLLRLGISAGGTGIRAQHRSQNRSHCQRKSFIQMRAHFLICLFANGWTFSKMNISRSFVREGNGAVKVAVFPQEEVLQACQQELDGLAKREAYVLAKVDARFTKSTWSSDCFRRSQNK